MYLLYSDFSLWDRRLEDRFRNNLRLKVVKRGRYEKLQEPC